MPSLLDQYLPLAVFMAVAAVISGALLVAPFLVAFKAPDPEKLSAYECGFNAFDDARMRFDVRFYLVSLLFIIFDLEVAFLFPWAVAFREVGAFGFWSMMIFLGVLTVGFTLRDLWQARVRVSSLRRQCKDARRFATRPGDHGALGQNTRRTMPCGHKTSPGSTG
jgi:NADH-quinone oxidoreductase subunit A